MNSCTDQQIKTAYEENKMSPEEISEDLGFPVEAIKAKLIQMSPNYRKACGQEDSNTEEPGLNFSKDQLRQINDTIYGLAISAEDEHLRFKAATYVRDDIKGRKEVVKAIANMGGINIFQINSAIQQARVGASKMREMIEGPRKSDIPV